MGRHGYVSSWQAVRGPRTPMRRDASMTVHAKEHGPVWQLAEILAFEFAPSADCAVLGQAHWHP